MASRHKSRRLVTAGASLALAALALAACGSSSSSETTPLRKRQARLRDVRPVRRPHRQAGHRLHDDRRAGAADPDRLVQVVRELHRRHGQLRGRQGLRDPDRWSASRAGNPPDIAIVPQPGPRLKLVAPPARPVEPRRQRRANVDKFCGHGLEGLRHRRRHVLRRPARRQREVVRVVLAEGVQGPRANGPDDLGRADRPHDKIVARQGSSRGAPGIDSGDATGWPVTDWLEDVCCGTAGPDVYDQWVNHDDPVQRPADRRPRWTRSATS